MSLVSLEAMASKLPVLMTPQCHFPEAARAGAAIEANPEGQEAESGLRAILEMSDSDRKSMGQAGYKLVKSRYSWERVACEMKEVYEWCVGGGTPPPTILLN